MVHKNLRRFFSMMRRRMKKRKDRKIFRTTASKTRTINLKPRTQLGGIRL